MNIFAPFLSTVLEGKNYISLYPYPFERGAMHIQACFSCLSTLRVELLALAEDSFDSLCVILWQITTISEKITL